MAESKTDTKKTVSKAKTEPKFTKQALVTSSNFNGVERDILKIVLDENKEYSLTEVDKELKKFKEGM
ncbi:hypothetical protein [Lactobacillus hominis]|uniref:Uncharacterized protein n=1 Tax=Lactobacillus hominis DSM 23910 = CRBIP 24.179 TaxID=1423758 RepID=I7LA66_9LACO|nr:hypothetical protein [Lactobacillus hominis]KRM85750.1 hypothetical protein FC41_GL001065 [Lactobacillus hominis DSM 23910 = CRBIP 24.179]MCT3347202.1 hypothetical protein [Lactobacillus hominis]CCI81989.1 Putative uncharacterized protein orf44 [Lactobacillus hominis DSM 23910 = CRBIP 24.179]